MSFLDVTSDDVAKLDDKQFRELIARLCEAEVEQKGLPRTTVTWGGHQDASDGGVDVRVEIADCPGWCGGIPKALTIFQAKDSEMTAAKICEEMRPDGILRPVILDALARGGAYVIACNRDNVADKALQKRKQAMEDAVRADLPDHRGILDFYDRSRLASWARSHPGVVLWLRNASGRPLQGWMSCEELSKRHAGVFLNDKEVRLRMPSNVDCQEMGIVDGIERIRAALRSDGACVRLTGLSGVGKTRLVQALFEESVGTVPLASHELLYTDISDDPVPSPMGMCSQIHTQEKSSIVVVDNCPPELHSQLAKYVKESQSHIRLLTVEYDVQGDDSDETDVFRLDPASEDLIERLLRVRRPELQPTDAEMIAKLSGGNARVAIALANTVAKDERLTGLKDADLFRRLFQQGKGESEQLLVVASCCSLVYSFQLDAEPKDGFSAELQVLAGLAVMEPTTFYRHVMELQRRELLQRRSVWAAILPHAIANRLAKQALEDFPKHRILQAFTGEGRHRLTKSFARRLGYLNDSMHAKEIAREWIAPGGFLGDLPTLDNERFSWFERVAPIVETEALEAIEKVLRTIGMKEFLGSYSPFRQNAEHLIRLLAYESESFAKAVDLLRWMQSHLDEPIDFNGFLDRYKALFALRYSGTMMPPVEKLKYLRNLFVEDVVDSDRKVALALVECGLEVIHPPHHQSYEFGCRVRAFGYVVKSGDEYRQWYRDLLGFVADQIVSHSWPEANFRRLLGKNFRGLWEYVGLCPELESVVDRLVASGGWIEGYNAVRKTIRHARRFGSDHYTPEELERLQLLEMRLFPTDLVSRVRLVCSQEYRVPHEELDWLDGETAKCLAQVNQKIEEELQEVGQCLAADKCALEQLLPELLSGQSPRAKGIMRGVLEEVEDVRSFWGSLEVLLESQNTSEPNPYLVAGILEGILASDKSFGTEILEGMAEHPHLGKILPFVQFLLPFDSGSHHRIARAAKRRDVPTSIFQYLGYGRVHEQLDDGELIEVLNAVCSRDQGAEVVLAILGMRFHGLENGTYRPTSTMVTHVQNYLLEHLPLEKGGDYQISLLSGVAFDGSDSEAAAIAFGRRLALHRNVSWRMRQLPRTFHELSRLQPRALLDGYLLHLDGESSPVYGFGELPSQSSTRQEEDPFAGVSDDLIDVWRAEDPNERDMRVARFVRLYGYDPERQRVVWRSFAVRMLAGSADPIQLLDQIFQGFSPGHGIGSRAEIMECYLPLLEDIESMERSGVAEWAKGKIKQLLGDIRRRRDRENGENSAALRGFE